MHSDAAEHTERDQDGHLPNASAEQQAEPQQGAAVSLESVRKHLTCPICAGLVASSLVLHCSHIFCGDCLFQHLSAKPQCPQCQVNLRAIPVRCLALDAVSATFAKTLDPQAQVRYESRVEEGKAAANKLNKMFWWLQSPMAVSGPDAVGGIVPGGPPAAYGNGLQQPNPSLQCHALPSLSQGGAAGAFVGAQAFLNLQQQSSQSMLAAGLPGQLQSNCSTNAAGAGRVRPPSQLAHQQLQLPPQPKHLPGASNPVSVPHGATDRVARGSHSGACAQSGAGQGPGHHRRNSEGSNLPSPELCGNGSNGGAPPAITGRRSLCNGDSSAFPSMTPVPNPLAQGSMGGVSHAGAPFSSLAFNNSSTGYNPLANLQQHSLMLSGLTGMPPNSMMMGGQSGLQEQAMVHQLLQQMYLTG